MNNPRIMLHTAILEFENFKKEFDKALKNTEDKIRRAAKSGSTHVDISTTFWTCSSLFKPGLENYYFESEIAPGIGLYDAIEINYCLAGWLFDNGFDIRMAGTRVCDSDDDDNDDDSCDEDEDEDFENDEEDYDEDTYETESYLEDDEGLIATIDFEIDDDVDDLLKEVRYEYDIFIKAIYEAFEKINYIVFQAAINDNHKIANVTSEIIEAEGQDIPIGIKTLIGSNSNLELTMQMHRYIGHFLELANFEVEYTNNHKFISSISW